MNWKPGVINLFVSSVLMFAFIGLFHFIDFTITSVITEDTCNIIISLLTLFVIYILSLDEASKNVTTNKRQSKSIKRHRK